MRDSARFTVGVVLLTAGLLTAGFAIRALVRDRRHKRKLVVTTGHIVETLEEFDGGTRYTFVVEYRAPRTAKYRDPPADECFRVQNGTTYDACSWKIGDARTVRYDESSPANAILDGDSTAAAAFGPAVAVVGVFVGLVGAFFVAAGILGPMHPFVHFVDTHFRSQD